MRALLDDCNDSFPHPHWALFCDLPFDDEATRLRVWFLDALEQFPPSSVLHGLWFGLFNPIDEVHGAVTDLDVIGSCAVIGPDPFGWAASPDWMPVGGRARSEVLASIYNLAYADDDGLGNGAEYSLALAFLVFGLAHGFRGLRLPPALSSDLLVVGGFNDGDGLVIGRATNRAFEPAQYAG